MVSIISMSCFGAPSVLISPIFWLAILTTIGLQVLSNFANDYGDGIKGTDKNRIGPMRALQSGILSVKEMKNGIITISLISLALTISLVSLSFSKDLFSFVLFIALGLLAIAAAIKYTVGKKSIINKKFKKQEDAFK